MKFNKSHILLISLISIFLLLAVGAASAASDADAVASDMTIDDAISSDMAVNDISEVADIDNNANNNEILSQGEETVISDDPNPSGDEGGDGDEPSGPIETTVDATNETHVFGDNITVNVTVKDNQSNKVENTTASNFKVYYKNATDEEFNKTRSFTINNESQFVFSQLPVGNYTLKIVFLNSTINNKTYLESETIVDLNITKTDTRINATNNTKIKNGEDVIIPLKIYVQSNSTLNVNASRINVYIDDQEVMYNCTNPSGGSNITRAILIKDFYKNFDVPIGDHNIKIKYSGNDNCNPSETEVIVRILYNQTIVIYDNVTVDHQNHNITVPFSIYLNDEIKNVNKDLIRLQLVYMNGTKKETINITQFAFDGNDEDCKYNISFIYDVPLNSANLTLIYDYDSAYEVNKTIRFSETNAITITDNITVDYGNKNITVPIIVNHTNKILYDDVEIVNVTTINLGNNDIILVLTYVDDEGNHTLEITEFEFVEDEGKYNISYVYNVPLNNATLTLVYANGTLNEAKRTIKFETTNTILTNATIKVNNHTHNVTLPLSINQTSKIIAEINGQNVTNANVTTLNLSTSDIRLVLTYNDGSENITVDITDFDLPGANGTYNISFIKDVPLDNANLTIFYGDVNKSVSLKTFIEMGIVVVNNTADYQDGQFVFKVIDKFDNSPITNTNITVSGLWFYTFGNSTSLSGSKTFTTDANGLLKIKNENMNPSLDISGYSAGFVALPVGSYNLTFKGNDSLNLNETSKITVKKVQAKIVASNLATTFGNVVTYSYRIVNAKTNAPIKMVNAVFRIYAGNLDATRAGLTNLTGFYTSPNLNLTANKYTLQLKANDSNLICSAVSKTLTVNKKLATITAKSRTVYYAATNDIVAKIKDKKTGKVLPNTYVLLQIYTSAKKTVNYAVLSNSKGVVTFSPPSALTVGKHKVLMTVLDNNYNSSVITRYVTVKKATGKFTASKVTTYYKSGKLYKIKLTNTKTKKGMYGAKVNIKVYISKKKYYNYNGNTSANGLIQFKINFKPGTYKVVISKKDKGYTAKSITRKIKVTKHPIKFKAVSLKVKKGKYFKVKVTSKKTKKALSNVKVKIKVYTGKKYKTYTKKTNKKGIASVKITQKLGKHKVIVSPKLTKYYTAKKLKKTIKVTKK